jgi:putative membrane protein
MLTDLLLASLHHLLFFGLIAMLVSEAALLRGTVDTATVQRLAKLDAGYGMTAGLLLAAGLARVFYGIKGYDFYLHNPWFHAKIGCFVLVGLLSILPTIRFARWRKALRADAGFVPAATEVAKMAVIIRFELILVAAILVFAAMMARFGGF